MRSARWILTLALAVLAGCDRSPTGLGYPVVPCRGVTQQTTAGPIATRDTVCDGRW